VVAADNYTWHSGLEPDTILLHSSDSYSAENKTFEMMLMRTTKAAKRGIVFSSVCPCVCVFV